MNFTSKSHRMKISLSWRKCQGDVWCSFQKLLLSHSSLDSAVGVYIIWSRKTTLKVGGGHIRQELTQDRESRKFENFEDIRVTWSEAPQDAIPGIINYLSNRLHPVAENPMKGQSAIEVDFPWS